MEIPGYSIELEKAAEKIKEKGYKTIALQIPEGLKQYFSQIVEYLENETGSTFIVVADPCFGACDLPNYSLKNLNVEFVVQIGHTPIPSIKKSLIPTVFINAFSKRAVSQIVKKSIPSLVGKKIGVVTTAQHLHLLDEVVEILKKQGFEPVVSEGDDRISAEGKILGCDFSAGLKIRDKIDSYLFIGSGSFHPLGLLLSSKKPVVAADPYENRVKKQELEELKNTVLKQRYGAIAIAKNAKVFGILIGLKQGQQRIDTSYKVKKIIDSAGKKSFFIAMDFFTQDSLLGFRDIDCFVSTACPRVAIDDYLQYKVPIITPVELEILLGNKNWDDYQFDQITSQ
jgi:2-(3-amino-3-carboxypropyl)histidine synthase